jgi:hypothetical protein
MVLFVLKGGGYLLRYLQLETKKIVNILNWGDEKLSRLLALTGKIVWRSRAVATGGLGSSAPPNKKICKLAIICEV